LKSLGLVVLAALLSAAAWWWYTAEMPRRERERAAAAEAAMAQAERASSLYRWRDAEGNLQVTDEPPKGRQYERISREPKEGFEVDSARN
jgi:hypothetical protein